MSNTLHIHRVLTSPIEKVYKAFTNAEAVARWLPPDGFTCTVYTMDVRVGGIHKASFTNFANGKKEHFGGTYLEVVPLQKLRYNDQFEDPNLPGQMEVTIFFRTVLNGTEIEITQSGIPEQIPLEFCYVGWQQSLAYLAKLVETNIPEA